MQKNYETPDMIIRLHDLTQDVMTVSQQVGVDWNGEWGDSWDPYNA